MSEKISRKYDSNYRKKLITKINKLNNKNDYIDVYNIIKIDIGVNFSSNMNGLFFNINLLSDECIENINIYIEYKLEKNNVKKIDAKITTVKSYVEDNILDNISSKLNNQEKTIFKKIRSMQQDALI